MVTMMILNRHHGDMFSSMLLVYLSSPSSTRRFVLLALLTLLVCPGGNNNGVLGGGISSSAWVRIPRHRTKPGVDFLLDGGNDAEESAGPGGGEPPPGFWGLQGPPGVLRRASLLPIFRQQAIPPPPFAEHVLPRKFKRRLMKRRQMLSRYRYGSQPTIFKERLDDFDENRGTGVWAKRGGGLISPSSESDPLDSSNRKDGSANEQAGQPEHPNLGAELTESVMQAGKSLANQLMLRSPRGNKQYDVPQVECPPSEDGMDRFACPKPDRMGRYRCIDDHVLCDGFIDCPTGEDEDRQACMFYKTTKSHLDVLADALLRWVRGR